MSEASFQRGARLAPPIGKAPTRPLPLGYGLVIGAAASMALWAGVAWLVARAFG
jgi:hypothetical protein